MVLCKWVKCISGNKNSNSTFINKIENHLPHVFIGLTSAVVYMSAAARVHFFMSTSEKVIFQPSYSAHKVEPSSYNVTLLPFNHLFDRPMHSAAVVTQISMKHHCSDW